MSSELCGYIGPGDTCTFPKGHERKSHSWEKGDPEPRITRNQMLMEMANVAAKRGTCDRAFVGAVIALDGRVISTGYVGAPVGRPHCMDIGCDIGADGGCQRTVHAEANAVGFAAQHGVATGGSTLYTTVAPCLTCSKLIINAGIQRVVYFRAYRDSGGLRLLGDMAVKF